VRVAKGLIIIGGRRMEGDAQLTFGGMDRVRKPSPRNAIDSLPVCNAHTLMHVFHGRRGLQNYFCTLKLTSELLLSLILQR
jgi:hypothetical protein